MLVCLQTFVPGAQELVDYRSFLDIYSLRPDLLLSPDLHFNKIPRRFQGGVHKV